MPATGVSRRSNCLSKSCTNLGAADNRINGYTYDANGNMTTPPGLTTASYDVENRMTTASPASGGTEYYVYGPDNQRVYKKKPDGTEELYMYGAFGERLGTYPFARTPSGLYGFTTSAWGR